MQDLEMTDQTGWKMKDQIFGMRIGLMLHSISSNKKLIANSVY